MAERTGITATDVAAAVGGRVDGDGTVAIRGLAGLQEAQPGDLSFLANPKYGGLMAQTRASAVIVGEDWQGVTGAVLIRVRNPDRAFMQAAAAFAPPAPRPAPGVHPSAVVAAGAVLGAEVSVGPHAVIEPGVRIGARTVIGAGCYVGHDSVLGEDCRLYPLASVRERTRIGNRVIVHNGAVIGSDGFGYAAEGGAWIKIPQVGIVEIGDDVEIGANTTIDRARFGKTVIANGVKLDNLIQIAHNVRIGEHTAMAAQVGISGSTVVGARVQVGGQAGMAGHLTVGDGAVVGAQAGVTKPVPPGGFVFGTPAMPMDKFKRIHAYANGLPSLKERLEALEDRVERMDRTGGAAGGAAAS